MRLETLKHFRDLLQKRHDSLTKTITTSVPKELAIIKDAIVQTLNNMTRENTVKLAKLGRQYNDMLRLEERQTAHWNEWLKERRGLLNDLHEIDIMVKDQEPPTLFDAVVGGDGSIIPDRSSSTPEARA